LKKLLYILLAVLFVSGAAFAQRSKSPQPENKIRTYVTDKTGTLTGEQTAGLEKMLSDFDKQTSTQVVFFMISSLDGASLEERSIEIAEQNGVGKKSKNNGVLLFVVKDDKKLRIEVGYGLEGALPDALCDQIIRKEITPQFKQGNYYAGVRAGLDAIIKATKGEYTRDKKDTGTNGFEQTLCGLPIFIFVIFFFIGAFILLPMISRILRCGGWGGTGRWFSGGSSGWSSGSSGSSFSGFSGGGGSFGGGGASGSW
jgi:uncharacterized protein